MIAIVQTGPESVEIRSRERPTPAADEVLIEVEAAGLCGSDAHAYLYEGGYEFIQLPRIMGHEYAGTVLETGADVSGIEVGQRVVERPIHECGDCLQCHNGQENVCGNFTITGMHRDGAYTDYRAVVPEQLVPVPDGVSATHAAVTEPTSVATRAVHVRSSVGPGDRVLVEGPGPIGVLTASVARAAGASVLVSGLGQDSQYRLPLAGELGAETIDVEQESLEERTQAFTDGVGFDAVFDTTGHHTGVRTAVEHVRKGGEVVVVGLPGEPSELDFAPLVRGELDMGTSYASKSADFVRALRLMADGSVDVDAIVDPSFSRENPQEAIDAFLDSRTCKPIFRFDD